MTKSRATVEAVTRDFVITYKIFEYAGGMNH